MKKLSGVIHLWLGMASGLIVLIVSLTGCIFVFEEEIFNLTHSEIVYIEKPAAKVKPLSQLLSTAQKTLGDKKKIGSIQVFRDPERAYIFSASKSDKKAKMYGLIFNR